MKVLVFAHTPPPLHGQSYMVAQLLDHVGGKDMEGREIVFHHVDARVSTGLEDIGSWNVRKLVLLLWHIAEGWYLWLRHRPDVFYYVPAPAKLSAVLRDWLVLTMLAPLFRHRVYHWHAAGLGGWVSAGLRKGRFWPRRIQRLFRDHDVSIVMNDYAQHEAQVFSPRRIEVVANGIQDPCPDFETVVLPERLERWKRRAARDTSAPPFRLLFLGHATATKGLFDAVEAVARANQNLQAGGTPDRLLLTVAGSFIDPREEVEFRRRLEQPDLQVQVQGVPQRAVTYAGYVDANSKTQLLGASDALCFPSYFPNEVQPVAIVEALAFGMPVLLSSWHGLPSMLPKDLAWLVPPHDPSVLSEALPGLLEENRFADYRRCFLERYTIAQHCRQMRQIFLSLAPTPPRAIF